MTRLVSFNIRTSAAINDLQNHWRFRKNSVIETFQRIDADVIGLQEARSKPVGFIKSHLPEFAVVSAGRNDGQEKGEACTVFVNSSLTIKNSETRWYSNTPDIPGSRFENVSTPRICTIALVTTAQGNDVALVNTHLDTQFREVRQQSLELLAKWATETDVPWIIFGDFNCTIDSPEMAALLDNGWQDGLSGIPSSGPNSATFNGFKPRTDGPRIDHILVPNGIKITNAYIDNTHEPRVPSDHWPVIADIDI